MLLVGEFVGNNDIEAAVFVIVVKMFFERKIVNSYMFSKFGYESGFPDSWDSSQPKLLLSHIAGLFDILVEPTGELMNHKFI